HGGRRARSPALYLNWYSLQTFPSSEPSTTISGLVVVMTAKSPYVFTLRNGAINADIELTTGAPLNSRSRLRAKAAIDTGSVTIATTARATVPTYADGRRGGLERTWSFRNTAGRTRAGTNRVNIASSSMRMGSEAARRLKNA